jgi:hypothetical protein
MVDPEDDCIRNLFTENAELAGIFNARYHWMRKYMCNTLFPEEQVKTAYSLERIFGYEFYHGESQSHFNDGGYLSCIEESFGVSRAKYACDCALKQDRQGWVPMIALEDKSPKELKELHVLRKQRWKSKIRKERFEPTTQIYKLKPDQRPYVAREALRYTDWAEKVQLGLGFTSGKTTRDLNEYEVQAAMSKYANAANPIDSYLAQEIIEDNYPAVLPDERREMLLQSVGCEYIQKSYAFLHKECTADELSVDEASLTSKPTQPGLDAYLVDGELNEETGLLSKQQFDEEYSIAPNEDGDDNASSDEELDILGGVSDLEADIEDSDAMSEYSL